METVIYLIVPAVVIAFIVWGALGCGTFAYPTRRFDDYKSPLDLPGNHIVIRPDYIEAPIMENGFWVGTIRIKKDPCKHYDSKLDDFVPSRPDFTVDDWYKYFGELQANNFEGPWDKYRDKLYEEGVLKESENNEDYRLA